MNFPTSWICFWLRRPSCLLWFEQCHQPFFSLISLWIVRLGCQGSYRCDAERIYCEAGYWHVITARVNRHWGEECEGEIDDKTTDTNGYRFPCDRRLKPSLKFLHYLKSFEKLLLRAVRLGFFRYRNGGSQVLRQYWGHRGSSKVDYSHKEHLLESGPKLWHHGK